jgi:hypothetical protein
MLFQKEKPIKRSQKYIIKINLLKEKKVNLKEQLIEKRNSLQNVLYYHKTHDLDEISFDNPKIGALLHQASIYGQININPLDNRKISIKIINPETGRVTFEANIPISKLTKFVEDINFQYEEPEIIMAA